MNIFLAKKYLNYILFSWHKHGHGIHSPFVYDMVRNVFMQAHRQETEQIEKLRKRLKKDNQTIDFQDFGSGSKISGKSTKRTVSEIVRVSSTRKKYGKLLNKLVDYYKLTNILEIGTSAGIGSAYLSLHHPESKIYTFEGSSEIQNIAIQNFKILEMNNIQNFPGNFDQSLPEFLTRFEEKFDLIYLDGNHTYEATMRYFSMLLPYTHNDTIVVLDDIHWSEEMQRAWTTICEHPQTSATINLLYQGIVLFRKEMKKQQFVIRY